VSWGAAPAGGDAAGELRSAEQVLRSLEAARATGRAVFSTNTGSAELRLKDGALIAARFDELSERGALFRLLGAGNVRYLLLDEPVDFDTPIVKSVDALVDSLSRWLELSRRAPPLSSVLQGVPADFAVPIAEDPERAVLLGLVDGRRTLGEVLDASRLDPIRALSLAVDSIERGVIHVRPGAVSLFPLSAAEESEDVPDLSAPPPVRDFGERFSNREFGDGNEEEQGERDPGSESEPAPSLDEYERDEGAPGSSRSGPVPAESGPVPTRSAPEPQPLPAPRKAENGRSALVGRYEVLCQIGRGGMGTVYLSRLTSEGGFRRLFAVKLLRRRLLNDDRAAQLFVTEARLAGQIHHPNVVSVVDSGVVESRPYLVMEYVEGASLRELLNTRARALPQQVAIAIVLDALAGLDATHTATSDEGKALRVLHGDVSPENLLIGVDGICRLSDFGIARSGEQAHRRTTRGRPAYLAPEQILGGAVDQRADVFSMGSVLFEALTGAPLFHAPTVEESLQQVCVRKIPLPSSVGARPSPALNSVCMKALERDPSRRFESAREMLTELRRVAMREELLASMPEVSAQVRAAVGRELAQRRLFVLERTRQGSGANDSTDTISPGGTAPSARGRPNRPRSTVSTGRELSTASKSSSEAPRSERGPSGSWGRSLLILASLLAVLAVIAALIWPEATKDLLSRVTSGAGWRTLSDDPGDPE
jgi:serine/threonine protein kinase